MALVAGLGLVALSCTGSSGPPEARRAPERTIVVTVTSETGERVDDAELVLVGQDRIAVDGATDVVIDQPVAGVARAEGFLDEPVVLDPDDGSATVRLLRRIGPSGTERRVLHFGGDVMLGRRYQAPGDREGTPTVDDAEAARAVVRDIAPIMASADATMVNLETVVGDLPADDGYPGKRFQLLSPPLVTDALAEMGVDVAALGNNHAYDWQEPGVRATVEALDAAAIAWAGAGQTAEEATAGRIIDVMGTPVGVLSATTVNGDFVNDSLPGTDDAPPADLAEDEAWQYAVIEFGYGAPGDAGYIERAGRRPGEAWAAFADLEPSLSEEEAAVLWSALTGAGAYPELQDWVARRGHGGAAAYDPSAVAGQVADLRAAGAALVVVQIHGGFQFSETPSVFMRRSAHAAIDAGADLVVAHHPHVLQGFEWYDGRLIAYSLGNLVFDQDFLSTFPSVILRTVFEGDELVEARVVPITIDRYRPVPVSGAAAARVLRLLSARSAVAVSSDRIEPDLVAAVFDADAVTNATVVRSGTTGLIATDLAIPPGAPVTLDGDGRADLPPCALVRVPERTPALDAVEVGADLLTWGGLEDDTADTSDAPGTHWQWNGTAIERHDRERGAYLHLASSIEARSDARQVARSTVPEHRWFTPDAEAADGTAAYTAELAVRREGRAPDLIVTLFDVNDTDPTVDPESVELHEERVAVPETTAGEWATATVDLTDVVSARYDGVRPEALLLYVVAPAGDSRIDVDDVRLLEWRSFGELPAGAWVPADALRGEPGAELALDQRGCG